MNNLKSTARIVGKVSFINPVRVTKNGHSILSFTVGWKANKEDREWSNVKVNAWNDCAQSLVGNIKDRDLISISGELQIRSFVGRDGMKRTSVEINTWSLDDFKILSEGKPAQPKAQSTLGAKSVIDTILEKPSDIFEEALPF